MKEAKNRKLLELHLGPIRTNCYLMIRTDKKEALIIDPGDERLLWRQNSQKKA